MFAHVVGLLLHLSVCSPLLQIGSDRHEGTLPPAALVHVGAKAFQHYDPIRWVAFAPDGKTVLTASYSDKLRFWDVATRKEIGRHACWPNLRSDLCASSDRKKIMLSNSRDGAFTILDVASRRETQRFTFDELMGPEDDRFHYNVLNSPDGRLLAIWEYHPPNFVFPKEKLEKRRFSLHVWDVSRHRRIREWKTGDISHVEFSPDGQTLIVQERNQPRNKNRLRVLEIASGKDLRPIELPRVLSRFVIVADGNAILGLSTDRKALHWYDGGTGKQLRTLAENGGPIVTFAVSADGKKLALARDGRLVVQDLDLAKVALDVPLTVASEVLERLLWNTVTELVDFSPDGSALAVANGRQLDLWNLATGKRVHPDDSLGGPVLSVHAHENHLLIRDMDMQLSLWNLRTCRLQRRFNNARKPAHEDRAYSSLYSFFHWGSAFQAISPDGRKVAALWLDGPIHVFDLASGKLKYQLEGSDKASCLAFSPNGALVAGPTADGRIGLWDAETGRLRQYLSPPADPANTEQGGRSYLVLHFSPDGRTLTACARGARESCAVLTWELATGSLRSSVNAQMKDGRIGHNPVELAPLDVVENLAAGFMQARDGKHLLACGPRCVRFLDALTGKETRRFGGRDVVGQSAVVSPDGKLLAAGLDNGGIRFWNVATGAVLRDCPAHGKAITSLAFADAGKVLVSGSLDGTVIVWDSQRLLREPPQIKVDFEKMWMRLGSADAEIAAKAMHALALRRDEAVAFFKTRLETAQAVSATRIRELLIDLESNQFVVRQRATAELERLDGQARIALEKALQAAMNIETQRRIQAVLKKLNPPFDSPGKLRSIRAIEVLERIGTREARMLLEEYARGGHGHQRTEDARKALQDLQKRP